MATAIAFNAVVHLTPPSTVPHLYQISCRCRTAAYKTFLHASFDVPFRSAHELRIRNSNEFPVHANRRDTRGVLYVSARAQMVLSLRIRIRLTQFAFTIANTICTRTGLQSRMLFLTLCTFFARHLHDSRYRRELHGALLISMINARL